LIESIKFYQINILYDLITTQSKLILDFEFFEVYKLLHSCVCVCVCVLNFVVAKEYILESWIIDATNITSQILPLMLSSSLPGLIASRLPVLVKEKDWL
jgi:hypothetical protein